MPDGVRDLIPRDKHDVDRAAAVTHLGYPAIEPTIPELLEWMQDLNWPVARVLQAALAAIGRPLAPYLRPVLMSGDDIWKANVLAHVIAHSNALATELRIELERIAFQPSTGERAEEADIAARDVVGSLA